MNRIAVVLSVLTPLALATAAQAEPSSATGAATDRAAAISLTTAGDGRTYGVQVLPRTAFPDTAQATTISNIIYLNRCVGGCTVTSSTVNSAADQQSSIPSQPEGTQVSISAFPWADNDWATMIACVKEIYSPFNVVITDVDPGPTVVHHEIIVAGDPSELGLPSQVGGISPVSADHSPVNNNISYAFAASYPPNQMLELCATVGQETAHSWGLDHEFSCTDPMTYEPPCGGQKFFRNKAFQCGTAAPGDCNCDQRCANAGPTQNSHARILAVFGAGQSTVPGPTVGIVSPAANEMVKAGFPVFVNSSGKRGTFKVRLILNGYEWASKDISDDPGSGTVAPIYATTFMIPAPAGVPDGVIDVEAQACDDLDQCASQTVRVTKGVACTDTSKCAVGQKCDAMGRCYWDAPTKDIGQDCTFTQECTTGVCIPGGGNGMFCSQKCFTGIAGQCPADMECRLDSTNQGYCFTTGGGKGCCSAGDTGATQLAAQAGLGVMVLAVGLRRRRRAR